MRTGLDSLQRRHGCVVALVMVASLAVGPLGLGLAMGRGWSFAWSVALGGGMQGINLWWLERSVRGWVARAQAGGAVGTSGLTAVRLLLFLAAVGLALALLPVHPVGFVVGLSTLVPTVLWHGLVTAGREA